MWTHSWLRTLPASVKLGFLRLAAERYFSATTAAIRRADPNHMVLGCRFAGGPSGIHPAVMVIAGKYCDIVSFNHYPWADLDQGIVVDSRSNPVPVTNLYGAAHDRAKKPLLLTEWSFPALDAGMPCTHGAGQRFYTQSERVQASELYARTLLSLPSSRATPTSAGLTSPRSASARPSRKTPTTASSASRASPTRA